MGHDRERRELDRTTCCATLRDYTTTVSSHFTSRLGRMEPRYVRGRLQTFFRRNTRVRFLHAVSGMFVGPSTSWDA